MRSQREIQEELESDYAPSKTKYKKDSIMSEEIKVTTEDILEARGEKYGEFKGHAKISQGLKSVMQEDFVGWHRMSISQRESLEMIAHKMARIINGDPSYDDNWVDICGYSQLIVNELREPKG